MRAIRAALLMALAVDLVSGAQVKALLDLTEDDVRRMFEVNVFGVFNCYSAAAKQMIKQGTGGKIIGAARFVSSVSSNSEIY